ncbi:MAG TPA: ABC transporter substrate-binding protein [Actinomycetes bacterium]|nr:ABC transporter substrate-binding protein [Actinomycetes bacterium]
MRRKTLISGIGVVIALSLTACGNSPTATSSEATTGSSGQTSAASAPAKVTKMTVGYPSPAAGYTDLYICVDEGIYAKNNLDVELVQLKSSSQLLSALSSGAVQIGSGVAASTAAGALKGVDLKYIGIPLPVLYLEMWGDADITSPEQLKGKKVAVTPPGSQSSLAMEKLLTDLNMKDDVELVHVADVAAEVAALENGSVNALVTQPPTGTKTRDKGFHKIMDFTNYPVAANAFAVMTDYIDKNKEAVAAFVKSEVECLALLHKDKAKGVASITKHLNLTDASLAEYSYDYFEKIWAKVPTVQPDLIKASFEEAASKAKVDAPADITKYVENSFIEELEKSGFIDSLYK